MESLFLQRSGAMIPFFIQRSSLSGVFLRVKFEGVDTEAEAEHLLRCEAYLPMDCLPELEEGQFYYHEVAGYRAVEAASGAEIGLIQRVDDRSPHRTPGPRSTGAGGGRLYRKGGQEKPGDPSSAPRRTAGPLRAVVSSIFAVRTRRSLADIFKGNIWFSSLFLFPLRQSGVSRSDDRGGKGACLFVRVLSETLLRL